MALREAIRRAKKGAEIRIAMVPAHEPGAWVPLTPALDPTPPFQ